MQLDYDAIDAYLEAGYVPAPRTPLAASQAPARPQLIVEDGAVRDEQYWGYPVTSPSDRTRPDEYAGS